jgi:hypothetical protein
MIERMIMGARRFRVRFRRFQWVAAPFPSQLQLYTTTEYFMHLIGSPFQGP